MSEAMTVQRKADLALLLVTACWGISYFLMDLVLEEMDPMTLNAYRFLGAFAVSYILLFPKMRGVSRTTIKYAFLIGLALTVTYIGCTYGIKYTTQSNAGFLCAMSVIFTPIFAFVFQKIIPEKKLFLVLILCFTGIALMSLNEEMQVASGDFLCIMCAMAYSADLLITERAVKQEDVNAYHLGVFQLLFTGLFMLVLAFLLETPCLPKSGTGWFAVVFLALFCTGLSFIVQSIAQQYTTSTHVGVIFCMEPVFAGLVAYFLAGEVLLPRAYVGAVMMLAGLLIMETDLKRILRRKTQ